MVESRTGMCSRRSISLIARAQRNAIQRNGCTLLLLCSQLTSWRRLRRVRIALRRDVVYWRSVRHVVPLDNDVTGTRVFNRVQIAKCFMNESTRLVKKQAHTPHTDQLFFLRRLQITQGFHPPVPAIVPFFNPRPGRCKKLAIIYVARELFVRTTFFHRCHDLLERSN